jgi:hypothetical protein
MLIRYRTNSSCTLQNFKDDVNNIILGNIITVANLSSGADKVNSQMYGTYPTGTYARVNATTYTYSKLHNDTNTGKTHYFRLSYDATTLANIALANSYTSGTDTLVNSSVAVENIAPSAYSSFYKEGIDIIVSNKMLAIFAPQRNALVGIIDIGNSSTTRTYTNSMLMMLQDFTNVPNWGVNRGTLIENTGGTIPYSWNYDSAGYATVTCGIGGIKTTRKPAALGSQVVFENPMFATSAGASNLMYGCYQIPFLTFSGVQIYRDASNLYRLTANDISLLVD